jgi:hypothetical protein
VLQPVSAAPHQYDGGRIVDRGRGKGAAPALHGTSDPLRHTWLLEPQNVAATNAARAAGRPASPERRWEENGHLARRRKGAAGAKQMGAYDPIRHRVVTPARATLEEARRREQGRAQGGHGILHRPPPQGSYDPVRCAAGAAC